MGWRNLPTLCVGWRNFFSSCAVFGSGRKQVLVLHTTYVLRVSYHTVVVLCQFFWHFFVVAGKWFWREISRFFVVAGKFYYNRTKSSSLLSGGLCCCVSFWFWRLRPEKKVTVVCLAGCAVVSVFGSGSYDRKKKLQLSVWRVRHHYYDQNKKRYSRLSGGCAIILKIDLIHF